MQLLTIEGGTESVQQQPNAKENHSKATSDEKEVKHA